jgi:hypothetical protein
MSGKKVTLGQRVRELDRERARPHRLTGELVLPDRPPSNERLRCSRCWRDPHEAEYAAWFAKYQTLSEAEKWQAGPWRRTYTFPNPCPACGGAMHTVTY